MKRSIFIFCLLGGTVWSQDSSDRVTVPFSDPSRPHTLKAHLVNGSITVKGYDGKDAIIETRHEPGEERERRHERVPRGAEGMKRITNTAMGLTAEEEDNVLTVGAHPGRDANLMIQVPVNTSLKLGVVNGGEITVDNISGEIEVNNVNGGVRLTNVSGSVIAHALNKNVVVKLNQITPDKSMSFSSLNGDIDVTLPADTKARVKLKTDNGDIYSDFDITLDPTAKRTVVEDGRPNRGKYRVRIDKAMYGTINGGGPEFRFETFNGNIYIHKPK